MKKNIVISPIILDGNFINYLKNKIISQKNEGEFFLFAIKNENKRNINPNLFLDCFIDLLGDEHVFSFNSNKKNEILDSIDRINPESLHFEDISENLFGDEILQIIYGNNKIIKIESIIDDGFLKERKKFIPNKFIFNSQEQLKKFVSLSSDFDYFEISDKIINKSFLEKNPKKGFVITFFKTHYNTYEQLYKLVKSLALKDYYVILASHSYVPDYVLSFCDLYIYEEKNLADQRKYSHGVAETSLIKKSLIQLKEINIEWSFKVSYDVELNDVSIFDDWINNYNYKFVSCKWGNQDVSTNSFFGNVKFILENMYFPESIEEMFEHSFFIEDIWDKKIKEKSLQDSIFTYPSKEAMFKKNKIDNFSFNYDELSASFNTDEKRFYITHHGLNKITGKFVIVDYYTDLVIYSGNLNLDNYTLWVAPLLEFYHNDSIKNGYYLQIIDENGNTTYIRNIDIIDFNKKINLHKFYNSIKNDSLLSINYCTYFEYLEFKDLKKYQKFSIDINKIKTFIDAGAHLGMFSLELLRQGSNKCYMIEANPKISDILLKNLETPFIKVINKALYKEQKITDFCIFLNDNHHLMNSLVNDNNLTIEEKIQVHTISTNELFNEYVEETQIDLFKIDIEGGEYDLFETFSDKNILKCESFLIEYHFNKENKILNIINKLKNLNYQISFDKYYQNDSDNFLENEMGIIYAKKS